MEIEIAPAPATAPADGVADGLAARLRASTSAEHRNTESRGFIVRLMEGELSLAEYARYLAQFVRVYEAMESRPLSAADPAPVRDTAVHRAESGNADLVALGAADWRETIPALPATERYVAHLRAFGANDGFLHLAHHYTRYLGDLSGGQIIATMLRRGYDATDDQLTFYRFDAIDNQVHYKRAYRTALDGLELDEAQAQLVVDEAKRAFDYSGGILDDLGSTLR
ncbi:biliverdin-producing heme oxygenase [soil metagenome]